MSTTDLDVHADGSAVSVRVFVKPRASKSRVVGVRAGALEVAVAAPPVDGAANEELVRTLARHLGVPRSRIHLISGAGGRTKLVRIEGLGLEELLAKVPGFTPPSHGTRPQTAAGRDGQRNTLRQVRRTR